MPVGPTSRPERPGREVELPIRIYALAKQLNVDHRSIIDACKQAGITGKGSALASLTDEEVAQIKSSLSQGKAAGSRSQATATATALGTRRSARLAGAGKRMPSEGVVRREDYIAPAGTAPKKVPVLKKPEKPPPIKEKPPEPEKTVTPPADKIEKEKKKEDKKKVEKPEKMGPAIKLAPMPKTQQPTPPPKPQEPAPQKPDIKLPADAIRASKAGSMPLSEHLRKHEQKRRAAAKKTSPRGPSPAAPAAEPTTPSPPAKERGRRGVRAPAQAEEEAGVTLGGREQRQLKRKRAATARRQRVVEEEEPAAPRQPKRLRRTSSVSTAAPRKSRVVVELPCTVRSFSEALGLPAQQVLGKLLELGIMSSIAAPLDRDTAELLAEGFGDDAEFREELDLEEKLISAVEQEDLPEALRPRAPVVTFLGHVDHGKTSLLDRIIGTDVVSSEKGGITQHIRAYRVDKNGHSIAFVDTPGHEAFTAMRARGATCTDIAVLVVAADDGVMPQTEEAIAHARAAEVPIIVALNKMDLPGVNPDRVMQELAAKELLPSEWGGDTEVVRTSAVTGEGIDELLDTLLTVADLHEYRANPDRAASGVCLEAEVQQGRGVVAKMLVERGTLRVGDVIVCGTAHGRVKAMYDTLSPRRRHREAGPSTPVNLTGLDVAPAAGERFCVLENISDARQIAERRATQTRRQELSEAPAHVTLENLFERLGQEDEVRTLNIILRADVRGSIEAIRKELTKLEHPEVQIRILQDSVGGVTEADVHLAHASDAVIIGFSVVPDERARALAEQTGVQIRRYDIIYQVAEDLKAALEGMLRPEQREVELGRALVQQTFHISRVGTVAGCRVLAGSIHREGRARLIRDSRVIGDYPLESLRREKDDVREVREGFECGIKLGGFDDVKEGDLLEVYRIDEIRRTF